MAQSDLIPTGISGLDTIFFGGISKGNIILVEGAAGTGKTLMGLEFIYRGITEQNEPGMIVVFETSPRKLMRDAAGFGWNLEELEQQNKLKIIFTSPQVLDQELRSADSLLLETAAQIGAVRIFIDGISLLRTLSNGNSNGHGNGAASYRDLLQQLIAGLQRENLTALLTHEVSVSPEQTSTMEIAEFLADTVIVLKRESQQSGLRRKLEIIKSRGQDFEAGAHTLRITGGKGLEVFTRVQAQFRGADQPSSHAKRSAIGVEALDTLMGGGVFDGSTTMTVGISGAGKTVLGVQLLLEGAQKQNRRGLMVSLDEHPAQILRNAKTLGLNLQERVDDGTIHLLYECPQELDIDAHFHRVTQTIEQHNIERLVVDGMTSYSTALGDQRLYRDFFHALVSFSKNRLMTTFFNYENPELFGVSHYMPEFGVSSIVDNIILMNFVELGNSLHRAITVAKSRGNPHQFVSRQFVIEQGGIQLLPVDESKALPVYPFQSYYGLLSRAPVRLGPDLLPPRGGVVPVTEAG
ncbi:MAG TPA: ATPase domain-containing protein [Nitrospiraceae bacterium]|nr:ATPase domain-containing protein [Nitrospiraceae bacterium]